MRMTITLITSVLVAAATASAATPAGISAEEFAALERDLQTLTDKVNALRANKDIKPDVLADVDIFRKGVVWALHYETKLTPADVALLKKSAERGLERANRLASGKTPWAERKGRLVRGYSSTVDGSVQPFGLVIPEKYDPAKPIRLDVVLHGSTRPVGLTELRFMARFDDAAAKVPDQNYIELHPLGRVENCYRWSGETDVFEAIAAVSRNYKIDSDRIVLRGMSMGASGTWHLGLKHPDRFVALGPYCGYVDTREFSKTPISTFVKVDALPPHQEKALHMLDSVDYAANAGVVPAIAAMGDKDIFFQAHVLMGKAMEKEGLKMVNLISPGTGHVIDPKTHAEQMRQIGEYATKGLNHAPKHIRFVTWTLKYGRCHWLQVLGLGEHYSRAEIEVKLAEDGTFEIKEPKNITAFAIQPETPAEIVVRGVWPKVRVGDTKIAMPMTNLETHPPKTLVIGRRDGKWVYLGSLNTVTLDGKRPGQQGPIDDAFTSSFLCVRGTGKPFNPEVQAWADASLKRFAYEWHRYFRGELPIKDDSAVTEDDLSRHNLILFGDPGSNPLIAKALPKLPLTWTKDELKMGGKTYAAAQHAPLLIYPNPLGRGRYLVINSGHTFHEKEHVINYLLFPRLGDWAVLKVGGKAPESPAGPLDEEVLRADYFDEQWRVKE